MKIVVNYFDNNIIVNDDKITCIEIENKSYFYKFVKDLIFISEGNILEEITAFKENNEITLSNKIKVFNDYFDFGFDSKKYANDINKYVVNLVVEDKQVDILKIHQKLVNSLNNELNNSNLPLFVTLDDSFENIVRNLKVSLKYSDELIDNLLLLIDIEVTFKSYNTLVFVNLKQYLNDIELKELYKYALYNQVCIILIDSQSYGTAKDYESKLIIDSNLDEFML